MSKGPSGTEVDRRAAGPDGARPAYPSLRPYLFENLEKIPRSQLELVRRLEWMLPDGMLTGEIGEQVKQGLHRVFDEDVVLWLDYVHAVPPRALRKMMADPTFLGVIAPSPHGARGLVELDLVLAHSIIDLLLGSRGESAVVRPLTEIEQGVMSYVLLETFKAFSPGAAEPGRHRLRLERIVGTLDEALTILGDEPSVAIVELKVLIGAAAMGYMRLMLPASAINTAVPPEKSVFRRERRLARLKKSLKRLTGVRVPLRAEIGKVELTGGELAALRAGDVMLVDDLTTRVDKGENGTASLRLGLGHAGRFEATVELVEGHYQAKIESVVLGEDPPLVLAFADRPRPRKPAAADASQALTGEVKGVPYEESEPEMDTVVTDISDKKARAGGETARNAVTNKPEESVQADAAELLNDVPLQVVVELGRVPITAEELVSMHVGKIIDLGRAPGEPVDLSVNGHVVARGELVEVEGQLGVRIVGMND